MMTDEEYLDVSTACDPRTLSRDLVRPDGLFIKGIPRSGQCTPEHRKIWRSDTVKPKVRANRKVNSPCKEECYLYVTFYLSESEYSGKPPDLDNLLKPFVDGLEEGGLIDNDRLFCGIRVNRKLVGSDAKPGVKFRCITAKTLRITKVNRGLAKRGVNPLNFRHYWKDPMQFITAVDVKHNNAKGTFIDHMPGAILRDSKEREEQYRYLVPGYDWKEGETVSGCIVQERLHHNDQDGHEEQHKQGASPLIWLQKWPD